MIIELNLWLTMQFQYCNICQAAFMSVNGLLHVIWLTEGPTFLWSLTLNMSVMLTTSLQACLLY